MHFYLLVFTFECIYTQTRMLKNNVINLGIPDEIHRHVYKCILELIQLVEHNILFHFFFYIKIN